MPVIFAMTAVGLSARAQQPTGKLWTLDECIVYAENNNIALKNLRLRKQVVEQDLVQSKAMMLPDLYAGAGYDLSHYTKTSNQGSKAINTSGSLGLNSQMTLYNGGVLKNNIRRQNLNLEMAGLDIEVENNNLFLDIIGAYTNILLARETILYMESLLETSKTQTDQARLQFNAGAISRKQLIQFESQLANDQFALTNAGNASRSNKIVLKQLLQLPAEDSFDIAPGTLDVPLRLLPPLNEFLSDARNTRPEIRNSRLFIQGAELDIKIAKAGYLPSVSAGAGISTGMRNSINKGTFTQLGNNFYQNLGITVSFPLFSRKLNETNMARTKIARQQAELSLVNTNTLLSQAVEQAYINYQNAMAEYLAAERQFTNYEEVYKISTEELRLGAANITEFVQQRNLYVQALQSFTQSRFRAILAYKILNFYAGRLNNQNNSGR
ncbi:TolC family protein [Flavihumibacter stibioxidans]|nr:TolC family protein [Flavihumibacter stibioxidans]